MPSLQDTYRDYETDLLEMIAEQWGIETEIDWRKNPKKQVSDKLEDKTLFQEILSALPDYAKKAFDDLAKEDGRAPRELFARTYGDLREMGAAIREKERPDRHPLSAIEILFYRGLIGLSFLENECETREYFFIPDEFLEFYGIRSTRNSAVNLQPLDQASSKKVKLEHTKKILELLALRLAILRGEIPPDEFILLIDASSLPLVDGLLADIGVLSKNKTLDAENVKKALLDDSEDFRLSLYLGWQKSATINDLKMTPGLVFEGQWINDPVKPRKLLLEVIGQLPAGKWFRLEGLIHWIQEHNPNFLRSGGEFEQWFMKKTGSEDFLKGFSSWPQVEGKLIAYMVAVPLSLFGMVQLGNLKSDHIEVVFRRTPDAKMLEGIKVSSISELISPAIIHKNGDIYITRGAEREALYQIARFCEWSGSNEKFHQFRITAKSIQRAESQGIGIAQIKAIFKKFVQQPIPSNIFESLNRWEKNGSQVKIVDHVLVRLDDLKTLKTLADTPAWKLVVEQLNQNTVIIHKKDVMKFEMLLKEAGFLAENMAKYND